MVIVWAAALGLSLVSAPADLRLRDLQTDQSEVSAGDALSVTITVVNDGADPLAGLSVSLVLSDNAVISQLDTEIAAIPLTLGPGESVTRHVLTHLPSPMPSGLCWLGARLGEVTLTDPDPIAVVGDGLAILVAELPAASVGASYDFPLVAGGGAGPVSFAVADGELPAGLQLSPSGVLFGVPTTPGAVAFTVRAFDGVDSVDRSFELLVSDSALALSIITSQLPFATIGREYEARLLSIGGGRERT